MIISETQIGQYKRDGAICIRQAVPDPEVKVLLEQIDLLIDNKEDRWTTIREGGFSDRYLWPTHSWMYDFCAHSNLPAIAGQLMESSTARLFFDHIFFEMLEHDKKHHGIRTEPTGHFKVCKLLPYGLLLKHVLYSLEYSVS